MSLDREPAEDAPITSVEALEATFRSAERAAHTHQVGLEHEKLVYPKAAPVRPVPYEGPSGIRALLDGLVPLGFSPLEDKESGEVIALQRGKEIISLEPGGQFELSGSPFKTAREAHAENVRHVAQVREVAAGLGLILVGLGYRPYDTLAQMPWMPKSRYAVMRRVLPPRGSLALNMMLMTATGQVSLDWESEADCVRKTVVTARLSPLLTALYANSPIKEGAESGFMSYRSRVWLDVDNARAGYLPAWFDGSFSYRAYVEWAMAAPMLFLRRGGHYVQPGLTFGQLLRDGYEGRPARASDWTDHLSTLFPEVRLKKVLEVRAADCASVALTGALAALWRGLLYDTQALGEAEGLLPKLTLKEQQEFHATAREQGLRGKLRGQELARLSEEMVLIARRGLERLDPADAPVIDPLLEVARSGRSPAEEVLEAFRKDPRPEALHARFAL